MPLQGEGEQDLAIYQAVAKDRRCSDLAYFFILHPREIPQDKLAEEVAWIYNNVEGINEYLGFSPQHSTLLPLTPEEIEQTISHFHSYHPLPKEEEGGIPLIYQLKREVEEME